MHCHGRKHKVHTCFGCQKRGECNNELSVFKFRVAIYTGISMNGMGFVFFVVFFNVCFVVFRVPDTKYEEIQPRSQDNFGEVKNNVSLIYMNCIQKPRLNHHCLICLLLPYLQIHLIPRINLQYV